MTRTSVPSVIFLNGASSSGKTTLGRALQDSLDGPYLLMGLDTCFAMVPAQWAGGSMGVHRAEGFRYVDLPDEGGRPVSGISYGAVGLRMLEGFHRAVREFVRAGNPVIVDEVMLGPEVRDHWFATLAGIDVVSVGVRCDLEELERREGARKGRAGLARWSEERVHEGMTYDLWVDTTVQGAEACAHQILAAAR
ncbi:chloramphenicol 3-O phosphotransferase [Kribbella kalugense]|uniref:Chloramphenicol 3-O phosphotransferase n=1 Tax=Kribbella kalugense TaxID=2512221 RepID=A0A4R7ZMZ2_9ACTN|nr:chloramphenicol 3-O phosphotransferase [Kribbella kalugense]